MVKLNSLFLPLPLLFLFLFLSPSSAHNKTQKASSSSLHNSYQGSFSMVYAFGDSYTDTGNAHFLGGLAPFAGSTNSPYGSTTNTTMNRLSNGRLVVDFLCEALSIPHLPPYQDTSSNFTHGVNFAVAGSTALPSDFFANSSLLHTLMWKNAPLSLQNQTDWFNKFVQGVACKGKDAQSCKADMEKALFWIGEMGVNDYARAFGSSFSPQMLTEMAVGHASKLLKTLLDAGAKYIVVNGLPPMGCLSSGISLSPLPQFDKMGCSLIANSRIMLHNALLQGKLERFRTRYPDCKIVYADYWNAYLNILMNRSKYQFQEPFKACCGGGGGLLNFNLTSLCGSPGTSTCKDPSKYMNWDGVHLTEATHGVLADLFLNQGFCRPSFSELIKNKSGI